MGIYLYYGTLSFLILPISLKSQKNTDREKVAAKPKNSCVANVYLHIDFSENPNVIYGNIKFTHINLFRLIFQLVEVINSQEVIEHIVLTTNKKKYAEFPLLLQKWRTLKEITYILKIPYNATIALQKRKLTLSDTFGIFLEVKLHLKQVIQAKVSQVGLDLKLLAGLNNRYDAIFDHPAMKAAVYLDPRYRSAIIQNRELVHTAKEFVVQIQQRLNYLKNQNPPTNDANEVSGDSNDSIGLRFDAQTAVNEYLGQNIDQNIDLDGMSDFEVALDSFNPPSLAIKESILEFWHKSDDYDSLRGVANAIFAIPPTETEVERDFSHLKFIFSDLRSSLSKRTLEDILCIHLNKEIYLKVNQKELEKLEQTI